MNYDIAGSINHCGVLNKNQENGSSSIFVMLSLFQHPFPHSVEDSDVPACARLALDTRQG